MKMTTEEAIATRLRSQQLLDSQFEKAEDMVGWMGMIQAQDYRHFRWAIGMRMKKPKREAVADSFASGKIVRLHLLRCTVQAVAAEDYPWMLRLCRDRNLSTIKSWPSYNKTVFSEQYCQETTEALKEMLAARNSLTKKRIGEGLARLGLPCDSAHLNPVLLRGEIEGVLVSGDMQGNEATWALADRKLQNVQGQGPEPFRLSTEEALSLLARKYFRSHSPASFEDFCWWTGLPVGQNRTAVQLIAPELEEVDVEKQAMFVYKSQSAEAGMAPIGNRIAKPGQDVNDRSVILLPPYDEYLIGYKSRWVSLEKKHETKAHNSFGIFHPVILYNGKVAGNWKLSLIKDTPSIDTDIFYKKREIGVRRLEKAKESLRSFFG